MTKAFLVEPRHGSLTPTLLEVSPTSMGHGHSFGDVASLRPLKIVADTANAQGGLSVPLICAAWPFDVEIMYRELDGTFPHYPANPLNPKNLIDLQRRVLDVGADVGVAFDGDADQRFFN